ncbi:2'-5' RNA ligase family protein [Nocardia testacea]|uniref:2'-5' RNA ligase family protein n=1 Tax=Nocardia testacea TaxID=248551 RepID=UPI003C2C6350
MNAKGPFPPLFPTSTADALAIRENDWSAFRQLENLADHWTIKSWARDRIGYYWYLTFEDLELAALAGQCQKGLEPDGIDFVPRDGLHLTLLGLGHADEVSDEQLERIIAVARNRLAEFPAFDLEIGPLAGSRSALRFSVAPWDELLELHRLLREVTAAHLPSCELAETAGFRPHLGIGYLNKPVDAAALISDVEGLRTLRPVTVCVAAVELVELRREGHVYRWTVRDRFALRCASPLGRREPASVRRPIAQ